MTVGPFAAPSLSQVISGLTQGTSYSFYIVAVAQNGLSSQPSNTATGSTQGGLVPTAPTNLTASAISATQINLAWTAATEAGGSIAHYNVFRNGVLAETVSAPTVTFNDTTLSASTQYTYQVSATDALGTTGPLSNSASATTFTSSTWNPNFPRVGFMGIGTTTDDYYNNVTVTVERLGTIPILTAYGNYDIFVTGADFEGWNNSNSRDRQVLAQNLKNASTAQLKTKLLIYGQQDSFIVGNTAYQTWSNVVQSSNFILYANRTTTPIVINGSTDVNYAEDSSGNPYAGRTPQGFSPAQWAAYYQFYKSLNKTRTGAIPSLFAAVSPNDASPLLDGVQLDNMFVDPGIAADWRRDGTQSTFDNGAYQGVFSDILAKGQRDYCDTLSSLIASAGQTQWLCGNAGSYARADAGNNQTTAGVMWQALNYSFFEGAMGKSFAIETFSNYANFLADYHQLIAFLKNPQAGMLNFCLPDGGSSHSGNLPWSTTQTAINGEFQWARYFIASGLLDNGIIAIQHDSTTTGGVSYRANGVDLTWYDEYDNAGALKGYLGQPVDPPQNAIYTWHDGTTIPNVYAREFANGLAIVVARTGAGTAPQPTGTVTITGAQLGVGSGKTWKFISGIQAPAVNTGAAVTSSGVTLQASRDGIILLKGSQPLGKIALLLSMDVNNGPITGGENNLGCYITLYGLGLGSFSDYGNTKHVFIGGVEVANYRYLELTVGNHTYGGGNPGEGTGELWGTQALNFQVGSLNGASIGTELAIDIRDNTGATILENVVSGGFAMDLDNRKLSFTPVNGGIWFISTSGTDPTPVGAVPTGTQGSMANPLRHFQTFDGSNFGGAICGPGSGQGTQANQIAPGQWLVARAGEYGADAQSFNKAIGDFFRRTGIPPAATGRSGNIHLTSYPGPAGGNAPERVTIKTLSGNSGGFNFSDQSRSTETTIWGTVGQCHYISISNMLIWGPNGSFASTGPACSPINLQVQALGARISNCDLSIPITSGGPLAGAIAGSASSARYTFNFVHDVNDPSGGQQNHGFYIGNDNVATGSFANGAINSIYAYNYFIRMNGGQGIMMRGPGQTETLPYNSVHHNYFDTIAKFGILISVNSDQFDVGHCDVWCNLVIPRLFTAPASTGTQAALSASSQGVTTPGGIYFGFNSCVGSLQHYGMFYTQSSAFSGGGTYRLESNVFYVTGASGSSLTGTWFVANPNGASVDLETNSWFDTTGTSANPPDAHGIFGNPNLVNVPGNDYHPNASSLLPNAGVTPPTASFTLPPYDFFFNKRPQGTNAKWCIGAIERVGG